MDTSLLAVMSAVPCSTWARAETGSAVEYLRGIKSLEVPEEFKGLFVDNMVMWPDPLEI